MAKLLLYFLVFVFTIYSLDSININMLFKKNKLVQARIIYLLITMSITYLATNFLYHKVQQILLNGKVYPKTKKLINEPNIALEIYSGVI